VDRSGFLLQTCRDIIASPEVTQFVVGITANPSQRRSAYVRWARTRGSRIGGFVVLDWSLTPEQAIACERELFQGLVENEKYGVIDERYYPSAKRTLVNYNVYISWWADWLVVAEQYR
jgi:hypothetical protein